MDIITEEPKCDNVVENHMPVIEMFMKCGKAIEELESKERIYLLESMILYEKHELTKEDLLKRIIKAIPDLEGVIKVADEMNRKKKETARNIEKAVYDMWERKKKTYGIEYSGDESDYSGSSIESDSDYDESEDSDTEIVDIKGYRESRQCTFVKSANKR